MTSNKTDWDIHEMSRTFLAKRNEIIANSKKPPTAGAADRKAAKILKLKRA